MLAKYAGLALLSAFWLLATVSSDIGSMSGKDRLLIFMLTALVLIVQGLILLFIGVLRKSPKKAFALNLLLALFAGVNLLTLYLIFFHGYVSLSTAYQIIILLVAFVLAYILFSSIATRRTALSFVSIAAILAVAQGLAFYAKISADLVPPPPTTYASDKTDATASEAIRIVEFTRKPNVYFISFDGMIPLAIAKEHMGLDELPNQDYLREAGFHRFRNAFSDGARTYSALNRLLALDNDYFSSLEQQDAYRDIYSGQVPSPLLQIFKANGYTVDMYFYDGHMGAERGNHVDGYNIYDESAVYCNNHKGLVGLFGFFGYCLLSIAASPYDLVILNRANSKTFHSDYVNYVIDGFSRALAEQHPVISFVHVGTPHHAPTDYSHNNPAEAAEYRAEYSDRISNVVPDLMDRFVSFITQYDPDALIYIYSDHGAFLSTQYRHADIDVLAADIQRFIVQDKYAILATMYPPEFCSQYLRDAPELAQYTTNRKIARQIIRCLADGQDPFINEPEFRLHTEVAPGGYRGNISHHYADYLYE